MTHGASKSSTGRSAPGLSRDALEGLVPERRFVGRNISKADVSLFRLGGRKVAVKDYGARSFFVRNTVGRLMVRRECRAYERAGRAPGLAPFLGRLGPFALATAWIESVPLADLPGGTVPTDVFDRLDTVLAGLHERGIAVADLHHRDVLVAPDGAVHVVDLAAAFVLGPRPGSLRRRLFERFRAQDALAAARMRARFTGRTEGDALATVDADAVRLWEAGRGIKRFWDRLRGRRD